MQTASSRAMEKDQASSHLHDTPHPNQPYPQPCAAWAPALSSCTCAVADLVKELALGLPGPQIWPAAPTPNSGSATTSSSQVPAPAGAPGAAPASPAGPSFALSPPTSPPGSHAASARPSMDKSGGGGGGGRGDSGSEGGGSPQKAGEQQQQGPLAPLFVEALLAVCSVTSPFVMATAATGAAALPSSPSGRVSMGGGGRMSIAALATLLPFAKPLPLPALPAPGAHALAAPAATGPGSAAAVAVTAPAAALDAALVSALLAAQALLRKAASLPQPLLALSGLLPPLLRLAVRLLASAPHTAAGAGGGGGLQLQAAQRFLDTCLATFSAASATATAPAPAAGAAAAAAGSAGGAGAAESGPASPAPTLTKVPSSSKWSVLKGLALGSSWSPSGKAGSGPGVSPFAAGAAAAAAPGLAVLQQAAATAVLALADEVRVRLGALQDLASGMAEPTSEPATPSSASASGGGAVSSAAGAGGDGGVRFLAGASSGSMGRLRPDGRSDSGAGPGTGLPPPPGSEAHTARTAALLAGLAAAGAHLCCAPGDGAAVAGGRGTSSSGVSPGNSGGGAKPGGSQGGSVKPAGAGVGSAAAGMSMVRRHVLGTLALALQVPPTPVPANDHEGGAGQAAAVEPAQAALATLQLKALEAVRTVLQEGASSSTGAAAPAAPGTTAGEAEATAQRKLAWAQQVLACLGPHAATLAHALMQLQQPAEAANGTAGVPQQLLPHQQQAHVASAVTEVVKALLAAVTVAGARGGVAAQEAVMRVLVPLLVEAAAPPAPAPAVPALRELSLKLVNSLPGSQALGESCDGWGGCCQVVWVLQLGGVNLACLVVRADARGLLLPGMESRCWKTRQMHEQMDSSRTTCYSQNDAPTRSCAVPHRRGRPGPGAEAAAAGRAA